MIYLYVSDVTLKNLLHMHCDFKIKYIVSKVCLDHKHLTQYFS